MTEAAPPGWRRLVGIVSLPRSGSTVSAAVLGAHSRALEIYEPWNDPGVALPLAERTTFAEFVARLAPDPGERTTLVVKETTTNPAFVQRLNEVLDDAPPGVETRLLILLRNPFHVFLSLCEARQRWWGGDERAIDRAAFEEWVSPALFGYRRLAESARRADALLVSYDRLVQDAASRDALVRAAGLEPEPQQADFGDHIDRSRIRGDPKMQGDVRSVTPAAAEERARQFADVRAVLRTSPFFPGVRRIAAQIAAMPAVARPGEVRPLLRALRGDPPGGGKVAKSNAVAKR